MLHWRWNHGTVTTTFTRTAWNLSEITHRVRLLQDHSLGQMVANCVTRERAIAWVLSHGLCKDHALALLWVQLNWANKLVGWYNTSKEIASNSLISIWFVTMLSLTVYLCCNQSLFQPSFNPEGRLDMYVLFGPFMYLGRIQYETPK